ncbi:Pentulose kinase [Basidiobolus meristosporus CBS 931.73]|uniref:Pentulose kinase n=1 Tax=Basidiobolus meristosporus CBS 931.73 TaxID=1314790 RepID=A0A1Y1YAF8_9FUNG|nr:Pentulose kinase [Basidiobolus meristosporus CBS 931.73]|eukprot:ORX94958.1 Pentulose kinase [Basidiobolus meristosporus CBS 931.73]
MNFVGVDVGTGSARAVVVDEKGELLGTGVYELTTWNASTHFYEQSSENIWASCCKAVKKALEEAAVSPDTVKGLGFDATCSLVVLDADGNPVSVSPDTTEKGDERNIILWMDHRAKDQAQRITETKSEVLKFLGGTMSLEMELPKILWLKENKPELFKRMYFYDLPDFLTFKATGSTARSTCSLVCKWTYVPPEVAADTSMTKHGWDDQLFDLIGLADLKENDYTRIGGVPQRNGQVLTAGQRVGGLSEQAARQLGLNPGTAVGSAVIDAYAGWVGTVGAPFTTRPGDVAAATDIQEAPKRLALICGTSSCHLVTSPDAIFVEGVWGPYYSACLPSLWVAEGGQSATGKLIDWVIENHKASWEAREEAAAQSISVYQFLNQRLERLKTKRNASNLPSLTKDYHMIADFHGNRSPLADPSLRGMVVGLDLDPLGVDSLALQYYATMEAIAYSTKQIIEALNQNGHSVDTLFMSGGLCKNAVFVQLHADITGSPVVLPKYINSAVVLGAAILGATAYGSGHDNLWDTMVSMNKADQVIHPTRDEGELAIHRRKYEVMKLMQVHQKEYQRIMNSSGGDERSQQ